VRSSKLGARLRKARLGLGDIGARVLADLEPVPGGTQLLRHDAHIGLAHVHHLTIAPDVEIRGHGIEQDLLFHRNQTLSRRQHGLARRLDREPAAVAGIENPLCHEARRGGRGVVHEIAVGRSHEGQCRAQLRDGLGHALVVETQEVPVLLQQW
jgi:hypothetical protein